MNEVAKEFSERKQWVLDHQNVGTHRKVTSLQLLLSQMGEECSIPLIITEEYRSKNQEIVEVFESIADAIKQLQGD